MPAETVIISAWVQGLLNDRSAVEARRTLEISPLGWSWKYSDEPRGRHDGDRCITTDTGSFVTASVLMLDSGFTVEPGSQPPVQRWVWFKEHGVQGYVEIQAINRPSAWAIYWCDKVEPYADNPTPDAPVGDVDMLHVQAIDLAGAFRFLPGDTVNVRFTPMVAPKGV